MHQVATKISVRDCGPVHQLELPIQPGATVLRGRSDAGKSQTLRAVSRLAGGSENLSARDGVDRGEIEGLGIRITVGRSVRRSGTLEALAIESRFPLSDLIDPGIDDPVAADRTRIKALLKIGGAKADLRLFAELLPGGVEALQPYVTAKAATTDDLVEMAGQLKRSLEEASRKASDEACREEGAASARREAIKGLDLSAQTDQNVLQAEHTAAVAENARLEQQARGYRDALKRRKVAEEALAKSAGEYTGPTVDQATSGATHAKETLSAKQAEVDRVKTQIVELQAALKLAEGARDAADAIHQAALSVLESARAHEKALVDAHGALATTLPPAPDQDALDAASDRVELAREAIGQAAVVRQAKTKAAEAETHEQAAKERRLRAECLRNAAKATDDVLSRAVASSRLLVRDGRLMTEVDGRGLVPYHERSDGTRTLIALQEKLERIRQLDPDPSKLAIIELAQRNRQDLQPAHWVECVRWAKENNVCIITAEVDDGELRAEVA